MVKRLLIVNIAITFALLILLRTDPRVGPFVSEWLAVSPYGLLHGRVWQLFTYMFIHEQPMHLLFNMLVLYMFGGQFEQQWGSRSFLKFIVYSGIGAGVGVVLAGLAFPTFNAPTIGISGSLNALLMAFAVLYPNRTINLYGVLPITGKQLVMLGVGLDILFALAGSLASLPAHFTGLLMGWLLVTGKWRPSKWRRGSKPRAPKRSSNLRIVRPSDDDDEAPPDKRWLN